MDAETFLGAMLIAVWAAVVLRGLEQTTRAARKGRKWDRAYLVGLSVGSALGAGMVLSIKNSLPGFLLAAGAGFANLGLWSKRYRGQKESIHPIKTGSWGGWVRLAPDGVMSPALAQRQRCRTLA